MKNDNQLTDKINNNSLMRRIDTIKNKDGYIVYDEKSLIVFYRRLYRVLYKKHKEKILKNFLYKKYDYVPLDKNIDITTIAHLNYIHDYFGD